MEKKVGFYVIYWSRMTEAIREHRGGLGSRLHIDDDGWWIAYAQWPDRESWTCAREQPDPDAARMMADSIEERLPPILMEAKIDLLVSP